MGTIHIVSEWHSRRLWVDWVAWDISLSHMMFSAGVFLLLSLGMTIGYPKELLATWEGCTREGLLAIMNTDTGSARYVKPHLSIASILYCHSHLHHVLHFKELEVVQAYENEVGPIVLDPSFSRDSPSLYFSTKHPHTVSPQYNDVYARKAALIIRMVELRIGRELLLQVGLTNLTVAGPMYAVWASRINYAYCCRCWTSCWLWPIRFLSRSSMLGLGTICCCPLPLSVSLLLSVSAQSLPLLLNIHVFFLVHCSSWKPSQLWQEKTSSHSFKNGCILSQTCQSFPDAYLNSPMRHNTLFSERHIHHILDCPYSDNRAAMLGSLANLCSTGRGMWLSWSSNKTGTPKDHSDILWVSNFFTSVLRNSVNSTDFSILFLPGSLDSRSPGIGWNIQPHIQNWGEQDQIWDHLSLQKQKVGGHSSLEFPFSIDVLNV